MQDKPRLVSLSLLRFMAYGLAIFSLLTAGFFFIEGSNQGFPDGYKSDFSRANEKLYLGYGMISLIFSGVFAFLGRTLTQNHTKKKLLWTFLLFVLFILLIITVNDLLYANLDHGQGG